MRHTQDFLVRVVSDRTIMGRELLDAMLGIVRLPADIQAIDCGDVENAPGVYANALQRYAEKRGLRLVPRLVCTRCGQGESLNQQAKRIYHCEQCDEPLVEVFEAAEEVACS